MEKIRVNPQLIPVIHALPHGRASDTLVGNQILRQSV